MTDVFEGSLIRAFRRLQELLRQMTNAAKAIGNGECEARTAECGVPAIRFGIDSALALLFFLRRNADFTPLIEPHIRVRARQTSSKKSSTRAWRNWNVLRASSSRHLCTCSRPRIFFTSISCLYFLCLLAFFRLIDEFVNVSVSVTVTCLMFERRKFEQMRRSACRKMPKPDSVWVRTRGLIKYIGAWSMEHGALRMEHGAWQALFPFSP